MLYISMDGQMPLLLFGLCGFPNKFLKYRVVSVDIEEDLPNPQRTH